MKKPTIGIISLGCPRNMVDSEVMLGALKKQGCIIKEDLTNCDVALINTCAFIEDAKQEAIDIILQAAELKKEKKLIHIIVAGCLPQRYQKVLKKQIPEVDAFLGTSDFNKISTAVQSALKNKKFTSISPPKKIYSHTASRFSLTPKYYTYTKIAEGCNNRCSYCAIYKIRGNYRSRPIESIIQEVKNITKNKKLSELNIIAQDTTSYGIDIYKKYKLPLLLKKIAELNKAHWIRLLYTHPKHFTDELIDVIRDEENICKYIDLPIQHISNKMLKRMNRGTTSAQMQKLIEKIRKRIPSVALRTSIIVGFPGEGEKEFKQLLEFIKKTKFERLGAFIYSKEENTPAFKYKDQVPDVLKKQRLDQVMKAQQAISGNINKRLIGKTLEVLVEQKDKDSFYVGRTQYDAPEVDGLVYIDKKTNKSDKKIKIGDFLRVKIIDTTEYDLVAEII